MTNEEAIKNLSIILDSAQRRTRRDIVIPDLIKSIEMAIEALKPETKKCPICGSDLYEYCFMCCYEGKKARE